MKVFELSARDRRTAITGATGLVLLLGAARGLPALRAWEARERARGAAIAAELSAARAARRDLPRIRDSLRARLARYATLDSAFIVARSPSDGAAALASTLEELADDASFRITGLQVRADTAAGAGLARVGIRVTGIGDVGGVADLVRAIEGSDRPLLAIRDLAIVQQDPTAAGTKPEALRVDLLVEGMCVIRRGGGE
jgi:type II secretion system (T2SS) protein M